jgi:hypothetical protein
VDEKVKRKRKKEEKGGQRKGVFWIMANGSSHRGQRSVERLQHRYANLQEVNAGQGQRNWRWLAGQWVVECREAGSTARQRERGRNPVKSNGDCLVFATVTGHKYRVEPK